MVLVSVISLVLWNRYHERLDLRVNQPITRDVLYVNQPPRWIKTDLPRIAIQDSRLSEIMLGESRAVEMVAASFAVQPWVRKVSQVRKTTSGIHVELQYRRPMALVEIGNDDLVPVDDEGVVLDGRDFVSPESVHDFWRIYMPKPQTNGLATGQAWDDIRVIDSIQIANVWHGRHVETGLFHIVNRSEPTRDRLRLKYYELWTLGGTIIIWGNPPGHEVSGEVSADAKITAILKFVSEHGPLDELDYRYFDVRGGVVVRSNSKLARQDVDFINLKY